MANLQKILLSGSTNGKGIKLTTTSSSSAATIHTAVSGTTSLDEIWIYAVNTSTSDIDLTIGYGGTNNPDNLIKKQLPKVGALNYGDGPLCVVPGWLLNNGQVITAWASTADVVMLYGYVNRDTQ